MPVKIEITADLARDALSELRDLAKALTGETSRTLTTEQTKETEQPDVAEEVEKPKRQPRTKKADKPEPEVVDAEPVAEAEETKPEPEPDAPAEVTENDVRAAIQSLINLGSPGVKRVADILKKVGAVDAEGKPKVSACPADKRAEALDLAKQAIEDATAEAEAAGGLM
jgi:hypothetical protein